MFYRKAGVEARRVLGETGAVTQAGDDMAWGQGMGGGSCQIQDILGTESQDWGLRALACSTTLGRCP